MNNLPLKNRVIVTPHSKVSLAVEKLDINDVRDDAVNMHKIMMGLQKAGMNSFALSHTQIESERPLRFFCMNPNVEGWNGPLVILNPSYVGIGQKKASIESCLSYPSHRPMSVYRFDKIHATFFDEHFVRINANLSGILAHIFQHEIDHMDGVSIYSAADKAGIILPR